MHAAASLCERSRGLGGGAAVGGGARRSGGAARTCRARWWCRRGGGLALGFVAECGGARAQSGLTPGSIWARRATSCPLFGATAEKVTTAPTRRSSRWALMAARWPAPGPIWLGRCCSSAGQEALRYGGAYCLAMPGGGCWAVVRSAAGVASFGPVLEMNVTVGPGVVVGRGGGCSRMACCVAEGRDSTHGG